MFWPFLAALVLVLRPAETCTVLELTGAGFAANAVHMLHAYTLFSQNNGTMYINSTAFEYKCSTEGGWHDFFSFDGTNGTMANIDSMAPGESCADYTFHDVDLMLHNMAYDWFSIDEAAAKKACTLSASSSAYKLAPLWRKLAFLCDLHLHEQQRRQQQQAFHGRPLVSTDSASGYLQVWRFNDWVKDQLEPVMEELHEMPAPRMAFHIRGGDKLSEDVQLVRFSIYICASC